MESYVSVAIPFDATSNEELANHVSVPSVAVIVTHVFACDNVVVNVVVDCPLVNETPVVYTPARGPEYEIVLLPPYEVTIFLN